MAPPVGQCSHCASLIGKYHDDDNFDNDDVHADACDDNYADGDE